MSSPLAKVKAPVVQYANKADYDKNGESALKTATGSFADQVFSGDQDPKKNGIVRVNEVTLTGLQQDTNYVYRVGDGTNWSEHARIQHLKEEKNV